jgi:guanylate kinase
MIETNELLEHAIVYNDYKGIPKQQVRDALATNMDVILRIDVQGAASIKKLIPDAILIFLTTEDEQSMVDRLQNRKSETPEGLKLRIATARQEVKKARDFDYVVINYQAELDLTVDVISAIITAEHHKVIQRNVVL